MQPIYAPVSVGELFDKISILEIKVRRIEDRAKLRNVVNELELLSAVSSQFNPDLLSRVGPLLTELRGVNEAIWDAENLVRDHDRRQVFDEQFTEIARSTYRNNDRRANIKRRINDLFKSAVVEEKSHSARIGNPDPRSSRSPISGDGVGSGQWISEPPPPLDKQCDPS